MSSMRSASSSTRISTWRQVERALCSGMVQQAARRGDDDVDSAFQRRDLIVDRHAAEDDGDGRLLVLAVVAHALLDLCSELARRREDQRAHGVARLAGGGLRQREPMQDRQYEAGGLAGAGLRAGEQVAAGEHQRNRLLLDRGGLRVAEFGDARTSASDKPRALNPEFKLNLLRARPGAARKPQNRFRRMR